MDDDSGKYLLDIIMEMDCECQVSRGRVRWNLPYGLHEDGKPTEPCLFNEAAVFAYSIKHLLT